MLRGRRPQGEMLWAPGLVLLSASLSSCFTCNVARCPVLEWALPSTVPWVVSRMMSAFDSSVCILHGGFYVSSCKIMSSGASPSSAECQRWPLARS